MLIFNIQDEIVYKKIEDHKQSSRQQRLVNVVAKPIQLVVELLVVTDRSVFEDHKRFSRTNDTELAFLHMRTYFSHFINGVCRD